MISPRMSSMTVCALLGVALDLPWPTLEIDHKVDAVWQVARSTTVKRIGERAGGPVNNCEELLMSLKTPSCAPCMTACTPVN